MSEVFNRRSTASTSGAGSGGRGDDPLAELARIVGAEDPFANLFDDAKAPGAPEQAPQRVQVRGRIEPDLHLPRALGLRGGLDRDEQQFQDDAAADGPLAVDRHGAPLDAAAPRRRGDVAIGHPTVDPAYYDEYAPGDDDYAPAYEEPKPRPYGGAMMALGLLAFAILGGAAGYAWTSGLFESTGLPGTASALPVIMASDKPAKVKPAAAPGQDEVASAKEIFERVGQVGTDTPETVVPREELPVAIDNPPVQSVPAGTTAEGPAADPEPGVPEKPGKGVQVASAEPLPPGSLSPEPRRVRTMKVLSDGTVVTGQAPASPLTSSRGIEAGEEQQPPPSLSGSADIEPAADVEQGDGSPVASYAADQGMVGSFSGTASEEAPDEAVQIALPPARPKTIPADRPQAAAPGASPQPKRVEVAALERPAAAAKPAATASGTFVVQISSQKSEADALASFRGMQRKYPGVFAGVKPSIKRADLADKGTYYRLRVGGWASREDATTFCAKLKAAGGDCVVARN